MQSQGGLNGGHDEVSQHLGSAIIAGGNVTTVSGRDTTLTGSTVAAGDNASLIAGGDLTITGNPLLPKATSQAFAQRLTVRGLLTIN